MWLVGSGVSAPVRVDLVKLRAASTNAQRGLPVVSGEVASIGRWVELRSDPLCLGQMLNRKNSCFAGRA